MNPPGGPQQSNNPQQLHQFNPTTNQIQVIQQQPNSSAPVYYQILSPQIQQQIQQQQQHQQQTQPQFSVIGLPAGGLQGLIPYGLVQKAGAGAQPVQFLQQNVGNAVQLSVPQFQALQMPGSSPVFLQAAAPSQVQQQPLQSQLQHQQPQRQVIQQSNSQQHNPALNKVINEKKVKKKKKKGKEKNSDMNDKEVSLKGLPDYLAEGLDVVFVGMNPSLNAAWSGRYYDGPGNHFWQALHLSGVVPELLTAESDSTLLGRGIGLTNLVTRTTRTPNELKKEELALGAAVLRQKLLRLNPKVVVFNGKIIYETFSGLKKFNFGLQPDPVTGSQIRQFVMPSTSARCSLLPKLKDKVPFFVGLKRLMEYLKGRAPEPNSTEVVFPNLPEPGKQAQKKGGVKEEFILRKEEQPSTSLQPSTAVRKELFQSDDESSGDELEMPVLEAEVPFPSSSTSKPRQLPALPRRTVSPPLPPVAQSTSSSPRSTSSLTMQTSSSASPTLSLSPAFSSPRSVASLPRRGPPSNQSTPTPPKQPTDQPNQSDQATDDPDTSKSPIGTISVNTEKKVNPNTNHLKRKPKAKDGEEGGVETPEKPKTSEKCYKKRKISLDSDSDCGDDEEGRASLEDTEAVFDKLFQSKPKPVKPSSRKSPNKESTLKSAKVSPPTPPTIISPKRSRSPAPSASAMRSPEVKRRSGGRGGSAKSPRSNADGSPVKSEVGMTSIWGKDVSSFDLPDDYVQDYLKEQKAKKDKNNTDSDGTIKPEENTSENKSSNKDTSSDVKNSNNSNNLLMIATRPSRRTGSIDVIPACLPDSVGGLEIEDILGGEFEAEERYLLSPLSTSSKSKQKVGSSSKAKKARHRSTDNLHPNLLPEDYLDEVIGQYFNADSDGDAEEATVKPAKPTSPAATGNKSVKSPAVAAAAIKPAKRGRKAVGRGRPPGGGRPRETDESSDSEVGKRGRIRPPASFYSMDFLDEVEAEEFEVGEEGVKVKTETELEAEYRHILYGGKKKKSPKIGFGKKKKKTAVVDPNDAEPIKPAAKAKKPAKNGKKMKRKLRKRLGGAVSPVKPVSPPPSVPDLPRSTRSSGPAPPIPHLTESVSWKGKKASKRASERPDMRQRVKRPFTSSKIEDVTGKYGAEEELVSCGICFMMDPPVEDSGPIETEVEWVGCDCFRWFHKPCTKLMKFTEKFSCRSVKMKCLEAPPAAPAPPPLPVIKTAVVKFAPDYPRLFMKNLKHM